jgi:hypothetical protein
MERWQIVIICVAIIIVWMLGRQFLNRGKKGQQPKKQPPVRAEDEVNTWYQNAREQIAMLDRNELLQREREWNALSEEDRLSLSETFLRERFGPTGAKGFTRDEKLEVGKTSVLTRDKIAAAPPSSSGA